METVGQRRGPCHGLAWSVCSINARANTTTMEQWGRQDVPQTVVYMATAARRRARYGAIVEGSARQMRQRESDTEVTAGQAVA